MNIEWFTRNADELVEIPPQILPSDLFLQTRAPQTAFRQGSKHNKVPTAFSYAASTKLPITLTRNLRSKSVFRFRKNKFSLLIGTSHSELSISL